MPVCWVSWSISRTHRRTGTIACPHRSLRRCNNVPCWVSPHGSTQKLANNSLKLQEKGKKPTATPKRSYTGFSLGSRDWNPLKSKFVRGKLMKVSIFLLDFWLYLNLLKWIINMFGIFQISILLLHSHLRSQRSQKKLSETSSFSSFVNSLRQSMRSISYRDSSSFSSESGIGTLMYMIGSNLWTMDEQFKHFMELFIWPFWLLPLYPKFNLPKLIPGRDQQLWIYSASGSSAIP